ncbi:DinB family protein [Mycobacterium sp. NPDC003323]
MTDPIEPDTKDWTWVLTRACPDCGFDPASVRPADVPERIRADAADWVHRLAGADVRSRPAPGVWSDLEYGCHIRDVHRIFDHRVQLMLTEDDPRFPNWDQDETAIADDYAAQDPAVVAGELFDAATAVADRYDRVPTDAWSRRGLRSNGSEFTVATIAVYHLHDIVHHAWDVTGRVSPIG